MEDEKVIIKNYKVLYVSSYKIIASKGSKLYVSSDDGKKWQFWAKLEWNKYSIFYSFRLLARLTRSEILSLYKLTTGSYICIAKKGIYKKDELSKKFKKILKINRGSRPLHLAIINNLIYYGEYFSNNKRKAVNIFFSDNFGEDWQVAYTFTEKKVRHIHGIFYDKFENILWVTTGDYNGECIIGYTRDNFKSLSVLFEGEQKYRTVKLLFYKDFILYGTDSPDFDNEIVKIDRKTKKIESIFKVPGSVINATQIGNLSFFSTTVEPSGENTYKYSDLWQFDGKEEWKCLFSFKKDLWNMKFFQFGTIQFPTYDSKNCNRLFFSGKALNEIDSSSVCVNIR